MKNVLNKILNEKGLNLIEVLVVMVSFGLASTAIFTTINSMNSKKDTVERAEDIVFLNTLLSQNVKKVFTETKGTGSLRTQGICSLVTPTNLDGVVSNINIDLPKVTSNIFSSVRWEKYIEGFNEEENLTKCKDLNKTDGYKRCFSVDYSKVNFTDISKSVMESLSPYFMVIVRPVVMNPVAEQTYSFIDISKAQSLDAKSVGFQYEIKTNYVSRKASQDSDLSRRTRSIRGFVWSGDVSECDYITSTKDKKIVALAGTGFGDKDNSYIYGASGFSRDLKTSDVKAPVDFYEINSQVQAGEVRVDSDSGNNFITSNVTKSVFSSCNERKFVCPQKNDDNNRVYQYMDHKVNAVYNSPNDVSQTAAALSISPTLSFVNNTTREKLDMESNNFYVEFYANNILFKPITKNSEKTNSEKSNGEFFNPRYYQAPFVNFNASEFLSDPDAWKKIEIPYASNGIPKGKRVEFMMRNSKQLNFVVVDKSSNDSKKYSSNACRQICTADTNYNTADQNRYITSIEYRINRYDIPDGVERTRVRDGSPVACTSCYMKSCDRVGLATFGPMNQMPTEPLDSGTPECVIHETQVVNAHVETPSLGASNANKCVSIRMNSGDNSGFSYKAEDCSAKKEYVCFNFGKHLVAKNPTKSGELAISGTHAEGSKVCFNTAKEIIDLESIRENFLQQNFDLSEGGNKNAIDFLALATGSDIIFNNLAKRGSYFAPIGTNQEVAMRKFAEKVGTKNDLKRRSFWVGLKTDNLGFVYAPAPEMLDTSSDTWALHFDGNGQLVPKNITVELPTRSDSASKAAVLYNHLRYKGVTFVNDENPSIDDKELSFLCRSTTYPYAVFLSKEKSKKFEDGYSKCKDESGVFYPPTTTGGWEKAYQLVNASGEYRPFPNSKNFLPAWVALNNDLTPRLNSDWEKIFSGTLTSKVNSDGEFIDDAETASLDLCINKDKGEVVIQSTCSGNNKSIAKADLAKLIDRNNRILKLSLIVSFENTGSGNVKVHNE